MRRFVSACLFAFAIEGPVRGGSVEVEIEGVSKISSTTLAPFCPMPNGSWMGSSVEWIGDLGLQATTARAFAVGGIMLGIPGGRGEVRIIFLNGLDQVVGCSQIGDGTVGTGPGSPTLTLAGQRFGSSVAWLGDLGQGAPTPLALAVGHPYSPGATPGTQRGTVWILFLNPNGSLYSFARVDQVTVPTLPTIDGDNFGHAVECIGDIDGDGTVDIAVSAIGDDGTYQFDSEAGAIYLVTLTPMGLAKAVRKFDMGNSPMLSGLSSNETLGMSLAYLGSPSSSTFQLAAGSIFGNQLTQKGNVRILTFSTQTLPILANLTGSYLIDENNPALPAGSLHVGDRFGHGLAAYDFDTDGRRELIVGASMDDDGGLDFGALWLFKLDASGQIVASTSSVSTGDPRKLSALSCNGPQPDGLSDYGVGLAVMEDLAAPSKLIVGADRDGANDTGAIWTVDLEPCVDASWKNYGQGCPGCVGAPSLTCNTDPVLGSAFKVSIGNANGLAPSQALLLIGPIPGSGTTCPSLNVIPTSSIPFIMPGLQLEIPASVPCDPIYCGAKLYAQVFQVSPCGLGQVASSRGLELVFGS